MNRALVFLVSRSFINLVRFRLGRLRQPKYLAGAAIGAAYFYFYFYRFLFRSGGATKNGPVFPIGDLGVELGALLLFGVIILFSWLWPASRATLHFTEAEIAWLFPAPLDRPTLIRYKLLKSQLGLLFLAFIMSLLTGRGAEGPLVWMRLIGWWIVFSTLQMHRIGASFALERLAARGLSDWKRRLAVVGAVAGFAAVIFYWRRSMPNLPFLENSPSVEDFSAWLRGVVQAGPAPWLLLPFRLLVMPWFAPDLPAFLRAVPGALGIMILHYLWVVRAHVSFEEASLAYAQKRAALLAARRRGEVRALPSSAKQPLFRLRPTGFASVAFAWKHALFAGGRRAARLRLGIGAGIFLAVWMLAETRRWPIAQGIAAFGAFAAFVTVVFTNALLAAQAVRKDLAAIDLLKTFPVHGWKIVLGQLVGPVFQATALQWFSLAVVATSLSSLSRTATNFGNNLPMIALSIAILLPSVNLAMSIVPTATTLLFPAWFKVGEHTAPGIEMTGMRLLMVLGQLIVVGLALLPAAILGGAAFVSTTMLWGPHLAPLVGASTAALTLGIEAGLGVAWLGWLFDRFDPSE